MGLFHLEEDLNGVLDDFVVGSQCHCGSSSRYLIILAC